MSTHIQNINILILGKTGVGKSALLNYLFGDEVAKVGTGKPVTGQGLYRYKPFSYQDLELTIYDSWGLEPDKANAWKKIVEDEMRKYNAKSIKEWFHVVIYCVDSTGTRLESFEDTEILRPLVGSGNFPIFALTKADKASFDKKCGVSAEISKKYPNCDQIEIESVAELLMGGKQTQQQGREEMLQQICLNLSENLIAKSFAIFKTECEKRISLICGDVLKYFDEKSGFFTRYDEEFKNDILSYTSSKMQNTLRDEWRYLQDNIGKAQQMQNITSTSFNKDVLVFPAFLNSPMPQFKGWDNDFFDFLLGIVRRIMPFVFGSQDDKMRESVENLCCELSKKLSEFIDTYVNSNKKIMQDFINLQKSKLKRQIANVSK